MGKLLELWGREPARVVTFVEILVFLLVSFGVPITGEQQVQIIAIVGAFIVLLGGEVTRSQVSSPATVATVTAPEAVTIEPGGGENPE